MIEAVICWLVQSSFLITSVRIVFVMPFGLASNGAACLPPNPPFPLTLAAPLVAFLVGGASSGSTSSSTGAAARRRGGGASSSTGAAATLRRGAGQTGGAGRHGVLLRQQPARRIPRW